MGLGETMATEEKEYVSSKEEKELIHELSKAIVIITEKTNRLEYKCEKEGWDPAVCFDIKEGLEKLGFGLATLITWNEDIGV